MDDDLKGAGNDYSNTDGRRQSDSSGTLKPGFLPITKMLDNGLRIVHVPQESNSVVVLVCVRSGSNDEEKGFEGISHFIEHMVFDGTRKRPSPLLISNEIEKLGGEFNASTSNERTLFYVKILRKHFDIALDVLSDMMLEPEFSEENIMKERSIVLDEINMVNDQPRFYQWILFQKSLFDFHPARNPVYGRVDTVSNFTREMVLEYFSKHYVAGNMDIVVIGDVPDAFSKVAAAFGRMKKASKAAYEAKSEISQAKEKIVTEKRNTAQAYMIIGFKSPLRDTFDSHVLDVIKGHLGRGQSGKIFDVIRTQHGLAYDVGVFHNPNTGYGYFAFYVNTNGKNIAKVRELIAEEIAGLQKLTDRELEESKTFIEGDFLLQIEDNQRYAEMLAFWGMAGDLDVWKNYMKSILKVTKKDVARVAGRYLKNPTIIVLE